MRLDDFDFSLPGHCIAQHPAPERHDARLLVVDPRKHAWSHARFYDLPRLLHPGDLLVLNNTRVAPCRLITHRTTGARVELTLLGQIAPQTWAAMVRANRKMSCGEVLTIRDTETRVKLQKRPDAGGWRVRFPDHVDVAAFLMQHGMAPLPHYIKRKHAHAAAHAQDRERYQTIYARRPGAVAAPTAGLHFTRTLLEALQAAGIQTCYVTLHVGPGTFQPIQTQDLRKHRMAPERYEIPMETFACLRRTRAAGGRIITVGTTSTRALEHAATMTHQHTISAEADNFIYPGYPFRMTNGLITNFHLPKSTPLLLAAAMTGKGLLLEVYRDALAQGYRFFSYGDAMLILPD